MHQAQNQRYAGGDDEENRACSHERLGNSRELSKPHGRCAWPRVATRLALEQSRTRRDCIRIAPMSVSVPIASVLGASSTGETEDSHPRRWRMLALLACAELLGMSLWFAASAVSVPLAAPWHLSPSALGWLTAIVQL